MESNKIELLDIYLECIIKPIKIEIKKTKIKVNQKRYFLTRKVDQEYLNSLEKLLVEYYQKLKVLINQEL